MKKYLLGIIAITMAIGFSAFTMKGKSFNTAYRYNGAQNPGARATASNYSKNSLSCTGNGDECGFVANQDMGSTPDFSGGKVTCNATTGFPEGGTAFVSNSEKTVQ